MIQAGDKQIGPRHETGNVAKETKMKESEPRKDRVLIFVQKLLCAPSPGATSVLGPQTERKIGCFGRRRRRVESCSK